MAPNSQSTFSSGFANPSPIVCSNCQKPGRPLCDRCARAALAEQGLSDAQIDLDLKWPVDDAVQFLLPLDGDTGKEMPKKLPEELDELQRKVGEWAEVTFPQSSRYTISMHMGEEIGELIQANERHLPEEAADLFLLLLHLAHKEGFSLVDAARRKLATNKSRKWETGQDGVTRHVSPRAQIAESMAELIRDNGLAECSADAKVMRDEEGDRPFYCVLFSCGELSGQVDVYGPKFIRIQFCTQAMSGFPIFESEEFAREFMRKAFVEGKWNEASRIPTKPERVAKT